MSKNNFQQFIKPEDKGARLKEKIRQEKKKVRQETKAFFDQKKKQSRGQISQDIQAIHNRSSEKHPIIPESKPGRGNVAGRPGKDSRAPARGKIPTNTGKPRPVVHGGQGRNTHKQSDREFHSKPAHTRDPDTAATDSKRSHLELIPKHKTSQEQSPSNLKLKVNPTSKSNKPEINRTDNTVAHTPAEQSAVMPLNKFIAHAGICSRRDAAEVVKSGKVSVNGQVIIEPGFKVNARDEIRVQGKKVSATRSLVYILLNKPKDHITTTEDPEGRKTVMDIVKKATPERVYPVGRLDRNTTGVLILTNDGELAQKLSHPSYEVRKIYEVTLDKPLLKKDFDELLQGITLEDGFISPDALAYTDTKDKRIIGIEIHSGRNRIVRRIFEKLGYDVRNLDRVMYANLTKKNVERGKWRFLSEKEVRLLKFMNASYARKK